MRRRPAAPVGCQKLGSAPPLRACRRAHRAESPRAGPVGQPACPAAQPASTSWPADRRRPARTVLRPIARLRRHSQSVPQPESFAGRLDTRGPLKWLADGQTGDRATGCDRLADRDAGRKRRRGLHRIDRYRGCRWRAGHARFAAAIAAADLATDERIGHLELLAARGTKETSGHDALRLEHDFPGQCSGLVDRVLFLQPMGFGGM